MHWLHNGDLNTKYRSATLRKNFQKIAMLLDHNGDENHSQEGMCTITKNYFDTLFTPKHGDIDPVLRLIQPSISETENATLVQQINSKAELHEAIMDMHPDKSLGPDGFNPAFINNIEEYVGMIFLMWPRCDWIEVISQQL